MSKRSLCSNVSSLSPDLLNTFCPSSFTRKSFCYISFPSQTDRQTVGSEKQNQTGSVVTCSLGGSEGALTFLGLDFKNFSFFPRGKVFEVGTVFCCRVRQRERERERRGQEREGARE